MAAYVKRTQRRMGDVNKPLIIVYDALLSDSKIPVRGSKDGVQIMPAIITHDTFGQDAYARHFSSIGGTKDEAEAFLLGNQGPDPLFYSIANPLLSSVHRLGNIMHKEKPNEMLIAFKQAIDALDEADRSVGRAYALGFLGHYVLDSTMHPLVYFHEFQLCDAGEPGLSRADGNEVHAVIESEYDEMVLTVKRGETVATFNPAVNILKGSDRMLRIVSLLYANMAFSVFGKIIPRNAFGDSARCFRLVQHLFHSGSGVKREAIARIEELVRPYSFYRAMSHRAILAETCAYDNREHAAWENPFTHEKSTDSFWDRYEKAQRRFDEVSTLFDADGFTAEAARAITRDLNFSGEPVEAKLLAVE